MKFVKKGLLILFIVILSTGCVFDQKFDGSTFGNRLEKLNWSIKREDKNGGGLTFSISSVKWDGEVSVHYTSEKTNRVQRIAFKGEEILFASTEYGFEDDYEPIQELSGSVETLDGSYFCDAKLGGKYELEKPCDKENTKRLEDLKKVVDIELEKNNITHEDMFKYTKWYLENKNKK